jgi:hypothetical protein
MDGAADSTDEREKVYCNKYTGGCGRPFLRPRADGTGKRSSKCPKCQAEADGRTSKPRGRLYDCDGCGDEFRYENNDEEGSGLTKICDECRKHGPRCLGGCGARSKSFGVAGKTHCEACKAKRTAAARAPASSRSLLSTGYVQAMRERMQAADAASAVIAPSPMFAVAPLTDPIWKAPLPAPLPARTPFVPVPVPVLAIEADDPLTAVAEQAIEVAELPAAPVEVIEQPEEATTMASGREATCQKSAGGCGIVFKTKSTTGKLPTRCDDCKAAGKAASGGKPRKEKVPRKKRGEAATPGEVLEHFRAVSYAKKPSSPVVAAMPLFTVRVGQLSIDCHTAEALDVLVERYGAAS